LPSDLAGIERHGAEGAHGVDQEGAAVACRDAGELRDGIEDARGGLAEDRRHVGDAGVAGERLVQGLGVVGHVLRGLLHLDLAAHDPADLHHARAIGAVHQDQHLAVLGHEAAEHGLDHEGAAALERDADMTALAMDDVHQILADAPVDGDEMAVARAVVVQRRLLHLEGGGQRPRRQQPGIAGRRQGNLRVVGRASARRAPPNATPVWPAVTPTL
jgi:hypothetical protein